MAAFKSLIALALAAVAIAAPAPGSLKVAVTSNKSFKSNKDIVLTATVTNPTSEPIRVIKYGTVLDELPTRSFQVTKDGKVVDFEGARITPNLKDESSYITIPAGGSVSAKHKIGFNYHFSKAGAGKFKFEPLTHFQFSDNPSDVVNVPSSPVEVDVESVESQATIEQTTPSCADGNRQNILAASISEARALAGGGATDVRSHPNSGQFGAYFGNSNRDTVWYLLDRIAGDLPENGVRTLYCQDTHGVCSDGIIAYTWLVTSGNQILSSDIYTCDLFYQYPETHSGVCQQNNIRDTRGGIIVHELSHAIALTTDVYGCDAARSIPDNQKVNNADNYACFTGQIHRDYNC
jgi:deuterolysin